ncbi:MAG: hypothetical protein HOY79_34220 [Streptomyces sp.]|nr:hypothetical protein [Streptomyces sp.]NUS11385.1 hypothetical protein [Streptomyces sp.]NUS23474.1 hypothetical protein [Streptomyces sp.]
MSHGLPDYMVAYLAQREAQRAAAIAEFLDGLTEYERGLFHDAAVMGYVRGSMHPAGERIPKGTAVVAEVVDACFAHRDLYPTVNADFVDRRTTVEYFVQCEQPDGSWEQASSMVTDPKTAVERREAKRRQFPDFACRVARRITRVIVQAELVEEPES